MVRIDHTDIAAAYGALFMELRDRPYSRENDRMEQAVRTVFRALDDLVRIEAELTEWQPTGGVEIDVP